MKLNLTLSLAAVAIATAATAAPLTPEQALQAALGGTATRLHAPGPQATELTRTFTDASTGAATLYLFTSAEGFIVTAADDAATDILLGYGYGRVDANRLPANVEWLLGQYSAEVAAATSSPTPTRRGPAARRADIDPLCLTTWDQGAPYNGECPIIGSQRAVTGCVATAMAQVMKVHNWPETGKGSHSYSFRYDGETYTEEMDFGATTFVWENMLDSYPRATSGTVSQRKAVAKLMHACGIACDMGYSPEGSGATPLMAGRGLINWLDYDKGLRYEQRAWHTPESWAALIYSELERGRPMVYCGDDGEVGHAFVCDGLDNNDYFHINWGWGGYMDGYFLLTDLNPGQGGTGGGSGNQGYTRNNDLLLNIHRPFEDSVEVPVLALVSSWETAGVTQRKAGSYFEVTGCGYYSYSFDTYTFTTGMELVDATGKSTWMASGGSQELAPYYGRNNATIAVESTKIPAGEYDVFPAFKTNATDWTRMKVNLDYSEPSIHIVVTDSEIHAVKGTFSDDIFATCSNIYTTDGAPEIYPGHVYRFRWDITAKRAWDKSLYCVLVGADGKVMAESEGETITIDAYASTTADWLLEIPETATPGDYSVALAWKEGADWHLLPEAIGIEVMEEPLTFGLKLTGFTPDNGTENTLYKGETYTFNYDITSSKAWTGKMELRLLKKGVTRYDKIASSETKTLTVGAGETVSETFTLTVPTNSQATAYLGVYYDFNGVMTLSGDYLKMSVVEGSGIEAVEADSEGEAIYYNLSGQRIERPVDGQRHIKVTKAGASKM